MQAYSFLAGRCAGFPFELIQDSIFMTKKCGFCKRLCYNGTAFRTERVRLTRNNMKQDMPV